MKRTIRFWTLLAALMFVMTACLPDDKVETTSTVDEKAFTNDQFTDVSVRPGNDFYRYALGGWLNNANRVDAYASQSEAALKEAQQTVFESADDPVLNDLRERISQSMTDDKADVLMFAERMRRITSISSQEELLSTFAYLQQLGYQPLVRLAYTTDAAAVKGCLSTGLMAKDVKECMINGDGEGVQQAVMQSCQNLAAMGLSEERIAEVTEHALDVEMLEFQAFEIEVDLLHKPHATQHRAARRSADTEALCQLMGIDLSADEMVEKADAEKQEALNEIIDLLMEGSEESVATLRDYFIYQVATLDMPFLTNYGLVTDETSILELAIEPARYYQYRLITEQVGLSNIHKQECTIIMEQLRTMMASRIQQLDWMSSTTKQEAIKKLQAMKFYIGYPEKWNDDFTPKVEGATLLEAVTGLRQQAMNFTKRIIGSDMQQNGWDYYATLMPATLQNAMYEENSNTLVILPCFIMKPIFDPTMSEATLYGTATVFGHELTHGFDANGANYDERGALRDWWTASDKSAFQAKQQQLVTLYNQLDAFPGQKANGEKTLTENMADYAGVTLALECYKVRLALQGFTGENYNEQLRKFWLSYACIWMSDTELNEGILVYQYMADNHSAAHNRINGVVRLFDEWYGLYDVAPTDALYLKPEERVKIW